MKMKTNEELLLDFWSNKCLDDESFANVKEEIQKNNIFKELEHLFDYGNGYGQDDDIHEDIKKLIVKIYDNYGTEAL